MLVKKEEHDLLVEQNIEKAVNLELDRIKITYPFNSWHEAYAVLLEELEETEESLKITKQEADTFKKAIFRNYPNEELAKQARLIAFNALSTIHEALQVRAVALKAVEQLKKATTDCNQ